jgi:hypothetical protein
LDLNKRVGKRIKNQNFKFKLINSEDEKIIEQIENMEEWLRGQLKEKLKNNCMCMAVLDGNIVAGFNYVSIGEGFIPLLKLKIAIGENEAWSEQITISGEYRRMGLGNELRNQFYKELKKRGVRALYGHRQEFNVASKQSARKYTSEIIVRAEYTQILWDKRLKCIKTKVNGNTKSFDIPHSLENKKETTGQFHTTTDSLLFSTTIEELK